MKYSPIWMKCAWGITALYKIVNIKYIFPWSNLYLSSCQWTSTLHKLCVKGWFVPSHHSVEPYWVIPNMLNLLPSSVDSHSKFITLHFLLRHFQKSILVPCLQYLNPTKLKAMCVLLFSPHYQISSANTITLTNTSTLSLMWQYLPMF